MWYVDLYQSLAFLLMMECLFRYSRFRRNKRMGSCHRYVAHLLLLAMCINFSVYPRPWNPKIPNASRDVQTPSVDHGTLNFSDVLPSYVIFFNLLLLFPFDFFRTTITVIVGQSLPSIEDRHGKHFKNRDNKAPYHCPFH